MDLFDALRTRRSIRKYRPEPVEETVILDCIAASMLAPSSGNAQPWEFVTVLERDTLDRVPDFHPRAGMCRQAAAAVLVCADPGREKNPGNWPADCAAATQNLLLALHGRGLGAVWCGVFPRKERVTGMRKLLGIPEGIIPYALIPLGWPAEEKPVPDRFDPRRVHRESW